MNIEWRPEEGSLRAVAKLLRTKSQRIRGIRTLFNRVPHFTYPKGERAYWKSVDGFGRQTVFSPHNAWRFFWHAIGGLALGLLLSMFLPLWMGVVVVAIAASLKEYFDDFKEQNGTLEPKNFIDAASWTLGPVIIYLFITPSL